MAVATGPSLYSNQPPTRKVPEPLAEGYQKELLQKVDLPLNDLLAKLNEALYAIDDFGVIQGFDGTIPRIDFPSKRLASAVKVIATNSDTGVEHELVHEFTSPIEEPSLFEYTKEFWATKFDLTGLDLYYLSSFDSKRVIVVDKITPKQVVNLFEILESQIAKYESVRSDPLLGGENRLPVKLIQATAAVDGLLDDGFRTELNKQGQQFEKGVSVGEMLQDISVRLGIMVPPADRGERAKMLARQIARATVAAVNTVTTKTEAALDAACDWVEAKLAPTSQKISASVDKGLDRIDVAANNMMDKFTGKKPGGPSR